MELSFLRRPLLFLLHIVDLATSRYALRHQIRNFSRDLPGPGLDRRRVDGIIERFTFGTAMIRERQLIQDQAERFTMAHRNFERIYRLIVRRVLPRGDLSISVH